MATDDRVACRIVFDCTPRDRFLGFTPNGSRLRFAEHVFYRFRDNRIAEVSSLIDRASIAAQLAAPLPMPTVPGAEGSEAGQLISDLRDEERW